MQDSLLGISKSCPLGMVSSNKSKKLFLSVISPKNKDGESEKAILKYGLKVRYSHKQTNKKNQDSSLSFMRTVASPKRTALCCRSQQPWILAASFYWLQALSHLFQLTENDGEPSSNPYSIA